MPETNFNNPRQGSFSSAVSHLRHALHFDEVVAANAFTNPAITFELYAVEHESNSASGETSQPIVAPRKSGALPPLLQLFQAVNKTSPLPLTAFANPAVAETQPVNWATQASEPKPKSRRLTRAVERPVQREAAESWHDHALVYFSTGQYDSALDCAEQALLSMPNNHAVWRLRGTALLSLQRWREAAQAFQRAVAARAHDAEAWLGLGRSQLQLGECEAALQSLGHALGQIPNYFEALFYQRRVYFQLLDYEKACASYARAAELNAEEAVLWCEYAER